MAKKCTIYYGKVVDSKSDWATIGSVGVEPIRVEAREPLGKDPEFCCAALAGEINTGHLNYYYRKGEEVGLHISFGETVNYCPYCGARILFVEHLKLKVVETPATHYTNHYEVVK